MQFLKFFLSTIGAQKLYFSITKKSIFVLLKTSKPQSVSTIGSFSLKDVFRIMGICVIA